MFQVAGRRGYVKNKHAENHLCTRTNAREIDLETDVKNFGNRYDCCAKFTVEMSRNRTVLT